MRKSGSGFMYWVPAGVVQVLHKNQALTLTLALALPIVQHLHNPRGHPKHETIAEIQCNVQYVYKYIKCTETPMYTA